MDIKMVPELGRVVIMQAAFFSTKKTHLKYERHILKINNNSTFFVGYIQPTDEYIRNYPILNIFIN